MTTVLVAEDEPDVRQLLRQILEQQSFTTVEATTGIEAIKFFHASSPSIVLLDVHLPEMNGWEVLQRIREVSRVPVIFLTASDSEEEIVKGLTRGADDYITKPFRKSELLARIETTLRRTELVRHENSRFNDGRMVIDVSGRQVSVDGRTVDLTPLEFKVLEVLISHRTQVLSSEQLLNLAWDDPTGLGPERVKTTIGRLRSKLQVGDQPYNPVKAVRGFGYRLADPRNGFD